ncbi:P-loop containing nucleoside triphosphate hydrolase protein [Rhodocollybia butyracea]|uniref:P-loop containing nucleoside triphosphate hydrolase protein n=1 Tax=Rhodocollybia butyracea TaxID=206335 RepID=A0A9P5UFD7_9AGAR|nr:P-loop containing nucleoside triphosphate hydrolase protein [Rhodocollybia butyracea]
MEQERAKVTELQENHRALSLQLAESKEQELNRRQELNIASDELENLRKKHAREMTDLEIDIQKKDRIIREANEDLRACRCDLEMERSTIGSLKAVLNQQSNAQLTLSAENRSQQAQISILQAQIDAFSCSNGNLALELETKDRQLEELRTEAMENEAVRRKLHNMVQELKGNIRVFCRVRPVLPSDAQPSTRTDGSSTSSPTSPEHLALVRQELTADMTFPDRRHHKEITLWSSSESATGRGRKESYNFTFDKVFEPESTQAEVFEEIALLAQSVVDGYNVCIFAYGQTGSGKSFTMEGGSTDATKGMIPRAVDQVFRVAEDLRNKGWEYKMEGQFLEIYNETINDLLGKDEFDMKHEIKHDPKTGSTHVTDLNAVPLNSPTQVRTLLLSAQSRRSVAATLMNERSSRSHSVFTLRITGTNAGTGECCQGCLNLVDLAGSERLNVSFGSGFGTGVGGGNDKDRLKETQSINRSLSALGDVIAALGEKGEKNDKHIPYRNSKLTYLLQNSLSGNSKTLMVLNLSPLATHLNESLTSLRFATKVNSTTLGTAKKQSR